MTGALLAARAIAAHDEDGPARTIEDLARHENLFTYVASALLDGEPEEVVSVVEHAELAIPLLERDGLRWLERGDHVNVERWLGAVPTPVHPSPDLDLVRATPVRDEECSPDPSSSWEPRFAW